jgi:hypothetical protein
MDCTPRCTTDCPSAFDRVTIWPQISAGDTRIEWTMLGNFTDPGERVFQVQVGRTGNPDATDWTNVGGTVTDQYYALDSTKRAYGKFQWTHYRIVMTTSTGTYYSNPTPALGNLSVTDWNRAREILRMERLRLVQEAGQEGYLLKRRIYGTACTCIDPMTKDCLNPQHADCYGTGIVDGYWAEYGCFYVEQSTRSHRNHIDMSARGTVDDLPVVSGRMISMPQVFSRDVWVDRDTDMRWMIHRIDNAVEIKGVPLVVKAEMRLLPFTHPVYNFVITDQVPS